MRRPENIGDWLLVFWMSVSVVVLVWMTIRRP